jgi:transcriptional regulator with PAS, ATPase and Fis domain
LIMKNSDPQLFPTANRCDAIAIYSHGGIVYANDEFNVIFKNLSKLYENKFLLLLASDDLRHVDSRTGMLQKQLQLGGGHEKCIITIYKLNKPESDDAVLIIISPHRRDSEEYLFFSPGQTVDFDNSPRMELSSAFSLLIGEDIHFKAVLLKAQKSALSDYPILIRGESGTGKEILARTIHQTSRRRQNKFVDINCAAIPDQLIDSELFGYEKGAFTGALPGGRRGLFEEANLGTLFLDEITDASLSTQAKLLRVLNEGHFKRVGSSKNILVDVRIISATNKNLPQLIEDKCFRQDLNYRLNTITINLPPLRDRRGDIELLAKYFLKKHSTKTGQALSFSTRVLEHLNAYNWPGNVRELKGVIDYMVTMATGPVIKQNHFPDFMIPQKDMEEASFLIQDAQPKSDEEFYLLNKAVEAAEKRIILEVLEKAKNKSKAIMMLGISRRSFYTKLKKYNMI